MFGESFFNTFGVEIEVEISVADVVVGVGEALAVGGAREMREVGFAGFVTSVAAPGRELGFESFGDASVSILELNGVEVDSGGVFAELIGFFDEIIVCNDKRVITIEINLGAVDSIRAVLEAEVEVCDVGGWVLIVAIFVFSG